MNTIPKQQLLTRWDSLSGSLREAITSDVNSQLVWKTGEAEHLPKEKLATVSRLTGYVLMGFIHPEDLARELHENLGIDNRIAASIAEPINKKIFQPLRQELETIYSPAVGGVELPVTEEGARTESPKPVLMDSISSSQTSFPRQSSGQAGQVSPPLSGEITKLAPDSSVPKFFQTGQVPKPAAPTPPPAPVPKSAPAGFPNRPTVPPVTVPIPSMSVGQAAPFMLHMESKAQPLSPPKSGFKISLSEEQFGKMEQKWTAPPKPAQIETETLQDVSGQKNAPRVVHYNEMKTPVAPTPKDKDILPPQITAKASFPPVPPVPKPPIQNKDIPDKPKIPMPPGTQQMKVNIPLSNKAEIPMPSKTGKTSIVPQTPLQKPVEATKQKDMLPAKPEEKELLPPKNL